MKKEFYFELNLVVFIDLVVDFEFVFCFIMMLDLMCEIDGVEYYEICFEILFVLYLFFIGKQYFVDIVGCIEKFKKKYCF